MAISLITLLLQQWRIDRHALPHGHLLCAAAPTAGAITGCADAAAACAVEYVAGFCHKGSHALV
jgi:hypothetical protein